MKNKEHDCFKKILFFTLLKNAQLLKKALKKSFVATPIWRKDHTSVARRHIRYKICDDTLAIRYSTDIVSEKKSHK